MEALRKKIVAEGENLGRGILKIDSFLNHQVDATLMESVGEEIASAFRSARPDRILTAEVSGIVPAVMTAKAMDNLPIVYARKHKPITMSELATNLQQSLTIDPEPELQFEPEALASYDLSARVLNVIKASGVTKFGFVGNEKYRTFGSGGQQ